jgi:MFS family permease
MAALGFLDGLGEALVSLSQAASGFLSDKIRKRKVFIWSGYLLGAVSRFGYAASSVWQHLIPFRVLDRTGKIRSAPRDAFVADISSDENRGKHFGLLRAMDNLGAVVGILVCITLFDILGYRLLFALAAIPSIIGSLLIFLKIREKKDPARQIFKGLSFRDIDRNLSLYIILNGIFALGAFTYSFLLIFAKASGFKAGFVPVLYLIYTAAASLFSLPFGRLSDKVGRKKIMILAYLLWAVICFGAIRGGNLIWIGSLFVLYGMHKAALDPVQKTLAAELAPPLYRASVLGGFQMIIGFCALPASLLAGILWDRFGAAVPFSLSLGLTCLAGVLLLFVNEKRSRPDQN